MLRMKCLSMKVRTILLNTVCVFCVCVRGEGGGVKVAVLVLKMAY